MRDEIAETLPRQTRLLRVAEHMRTQNWTAIGIDFLIVVLGVFVGIQVANWNEARTFDAHERDHLRNLRTEIENDIETSTVKRNFYTGVNAAGERALAFLEKDEPCTDNQCWSLLVDFFHASQWVDVGVTQTTYTEMRRIGLPRSRELAMVIEPYYTINVGINTVSNERPVYRTLIRGLIPVRAQQVMWTTCHQAVGGIETFNNNCAAGIPMDQAARAIEKIRTHPEIFSTLTQWTSTGAPIVKYLGGQNQESGKAIAAINKELGAEQ